MIVPVYAGVAFGAAITIPRFESQLFPHLVTRANVGSATAIYSSIASGMLTLTAIVFSLSFVIVQVTSSAFSPRLVAFIARDPVLANAMGVFVATFLYAVGALSGIDRGGSQAVPMVSVNIVVSLLLASVVMFVVLLRRIETLQINRMLIYTGNQGRKAIEKLYTPLKSATPAARPATETAPRSTTILAHQGQPQALQTIDVKHLLRLACNSGAVIEMAAEVGDTVVDGMPLLRVHDAAKPIPGRALRRSITLGDERTFEYDPKYAFRLLVDIAIRALSPGINDPTTAVQALDQMQDLLLRLGRSQLEIGRFCDSEGKLRVIMHFPEWSDFLRLAFREILAYGQNSVQVPRRMKALIHDLLEVLPAQRHSALRHWDARLSSVIARSFPDIEEQREASTEDRQGLGISPHPPGDLQQ